MKKVWLLSPYFCLILPLVLILCLMDGCQDKEAMAEIEEQNKALVKRYVETFNKGEYEAFKELLSTDYTIYNPSGYPEPACREALIENYKGALEAFSEFTWSIEDMIAEEDKVISRIIAKGTYKGGVPGLPKTGKEFEFCTITIMRIEDGKVVEEWQEDDQLGLTRQLGMELTPKKD